MHVQRAKLATSAYDAKFGCAMEISILRSVHACECEMCACPCAWSPCWSISWWKFHRMSTHCSCAHGTSLCFLSFCCVSAMLDVIRSRSSSKLPIYVGLLLGTYGLLVACHWLL